MSEELAVKVMTLKEARASVRNINKQLGNLRQRVEEFHNRQGWVALGYDTWQICVKEEFQISREYAFRLLNAAQIEREITNSVLPTGNIPERQLRPLAALPPGERKAVWDSAMEKAKATGEPITAKAIEEEVRPLLSKKISYGKKVQTPTHTSVSSYAPTFNERFSDEDPVIGIVCPKCGHTFGSGSQLNGRDNDGFWEN